MRYLVVATGSVQTHTFIIDTDDTDITDRAVEYVMRQEYGEKYVERYDLYTKGDVAQWMLALTQE